MRVEAIDYLNKAGFDVKTAESPDLWTHLESHFYGPRRFGAKFDALPADAVADVIMKSEEALLTALMKSHKSGGKLSPVSITLSMPFVVGRDDVAAPSQAEGDDVLELIDQPGTAMERAIRVLPTAKSAMPKTRKTTIKGGVYADGRTVGFFDIAPGDHAHETASCKRVYRATPEEIEALAYDMERNADDIVVASAAKCASMVKKARRAVKR